MDLSLNADAALRAYLPPESWNGEAQHRFIFRTEDGDEETLLARLTMVQPDVNNERFEHCVVLRPENAEISRIFVADNLWYRLGRKEIDAWMTPRAARRFNWSLFEQSFNDSRFVRGISRFWSIQTEKRRETLRIGADGWGDVLGFEDAETGSTHHTQGFIWNSDYHRSYDETDMQFLRQKHANFRRQIRARWNISDGEIQTALLWRPLDNAARDAWAFKCENGTWDDVISMATIALKVRLGQMKRQANEPCEWGFTAYGATPVSGADLPDDDDFLFHWRAAIVQVFKPDNIDEAGAMVVENCRCVWSHINSSELGRVRVEPPSQHELMEANLQLREWAFAHFPPEEAQRLLSF